MPTTGYNTQIFTPFGTAYIPEQRGARVPNEPLSATVRAVLITASTVLFAALYLV